MTDFVGDNDHGDTVPPTTEVILMRVTQDRDTLYAEVCRLGPRVAELLSERDEARREICYSEAADMAIKTGKVMGVEENAKAIAKERGWDCFDRCTHYCDSCGFLITQESSHKVATDDPTSSGLLCNYCWRHRVKDEPNLFSGMENKALDRLAELDEELGLI